MQPRIIIVLLSVLLLGACTEIELASHVVKTNMPGDSQSEGGLKVGSPYKVDGKRYTPKETYNHTETGIASWYGREFHGKPTANGEIFDMNELTAAHPTLQLPSLVRVTNLENGRSLIVRVNDRGPFKRGRIIDLSKRSAELLGFRAKGTAKVKIQVLAEESKMLADAARRGQDTRGVEVAMNEGRRGAMQQLGQKTTSISPFPLKDRTAVTTGKAGIQQISATSGAALQPVENQTLLIPEIQGHVRDGNFLPDPVVSQVPVSASNIYVQAGAFGSPENANRLADALQEFGQAQVYPAVVNGRQFYRVRLGPMKTVEQADTVLSRIAGSGNNDAIIVVD